MAMATDETGNIYATGTSNSDYLTVKYDASGTVLWRAR